MNVLLFMKEIHNVWNDETLISIIKYLFFIMMLLWFNRQDWRYGSFGYISQVRVQMLCSLCPFKMLFLVRWWTKNSRTKSQLNIQLMFHCWTGLCYLCAKNYMGALMLKKDQLVLWLFVWNKTKYHYKFETLQSSV